MGSFILHIPPTVIKKNKPKSNRTEKNLYPSSSSKGKCTNRQTDRQKLKKYRFIIFLPKMIDSYKYLMYRHAFLLFYYNIDCIAARSVTVKPTGCGFDPHSRR